MPFRSLSKVTFTPEHQRMTEAEQQQELAAAYEIVTNNGGTMETTIVIPAEQAALVITSYPDERASLKAQLQIAARGAYRLDSQSCYTLEDWNVIVEESRNEAVVGV